MVVAGVVERCKVIGISYHQVIGPGICCRTAKPDVGFQEDIVLQESRERIQFSLPELNRDQDFPAAALQSSHWQNSAETDNEPEEDDEMKVNPRLHPPKLGGW